MEESEKRRERLKAMRMEAGGRAGGDDCSGLAPSGLSNPLVESESPCPSQYSSSRFGYYTDPMAAFSGSRRGNITPQVSQGHYNGPPRPMYQDMNPSPLYHGPGANSPGQTIFQVPGTHFDQSPLQSPMQVVTPLGRPQGYPPNAWGGTGSALNYSDPPPKFSNPGFVQGNPSYVHYGGGGGGGGRFNNSPHYDSGRGRGRWQGNRTNPRSGPGGRRGAGPHEPSSAEQRPYMYYRKEMVEDPWKMLTPVVWKYINVNSRDSDESWLPKSISSTKKAKVSGEASQISIPQQSLAEYLAFSFNDSTDEAVDDDQTT